MKTNLTKFEKAIYPITVIAVLVILIFMNYV